MEFLKILSEIHGFTLFIAVCCTYYILKYVLYHLPTRILRSFVIRKRGWPPAHLDADGDWKPKSD